MYYCIPIIVNDRKYVTFSLYKENKNYNFVASLYNEGKTELLRVKKSLRATCSECRDKDISVKLSKESMIDKGRLKLIFSKGSGIAKLEGSGFFIEDRESEYAICYREDKLSSYKELDINLALKTEEGVFYSASLKFHMIPSRYYFKAALDFGSESSQFKIEGDNNRGGFIDIIEEAKKTYHDPDNNVEGQYKGKTDNKAFHQYDSDNNAPKNHYLFRTLFYVNKDNNTPLFLSLKKDDDVLSQKFPLLSNIKISLLEENYPKVIYGKIIYQIIKTIYSISDINNSNDRHVGVQLSLLVPNVMDFKRVNELIEDLQLMLETRMSKNLHIEITPINESDASFAGYVQTIGNMKGTVLTIDGGKGTFDYSLSKIDKKNGILKIGGILSGGFVGAGGTITYALFEHICAVITGSLNADKRQDLMKKILKEADQKGKLDLYNALEEIKKFYSSDNLSEQNAERCNKLKELTIDHNLLTAGGLANILKEEVNGCLGDQYSILLKASYDICTKLINSIEEKIGKKPKISNIVFAGRALKFPILQTVMKTLIDEKWGIKDITYTKSAKGVCLDGAINTVSGNLRVNYNCGLLNLPQIHSIGGALSKSSLYYDTDKYDGFAVNEDFFINGMMIQENQEVRVNGEKLKFRQRNKEKELYYTGSGFLLRGRNDYDIASYEKSENESEEMLRLSSKFPFYNAEEISHLPITRI